MSLDSPLSPEAGALPDSERLPGAVYRLYAAMLLNGETGLGGKLLYAGEMRGDVRTLLFAANIAGVASLAASADPAVQRQAMRDGAVDFLVTSLEEALRILKNEIRKRQTISVGVALAPDQLVMQMLDRGVLPDLLPPAAWSAAETGLTFERLEAFLAQGTLRIQDAPPLPGEYVSWSVDRDSSRWLPRIDVCAREIIPAEDRLRERWLRLAPRYLGRMAQRRHGVTLSSAETQQLREKVRQLMAEDTDDPDMLPRVQIDGYPVR